MLLQLEASRHLSVATAQALFKLNKLDMQLTALMLAVDSKHC
jgi:hypothetical protein